jgi:hypothetical protein
VLEVENHGLRLGSRYIVAQLFAGAGDMHREVRAEFTGQRPGQSRIGFEKNYTLRHTSPNLQPSSTAYIDLRLGLRGGWETDSTDI